MEFAAGFFSMPGGPEWIVVFLVILIIFGPKSLPKIGHAIGRGIREFKDASDGITKAIEEEASAAEREKETSKTEGDSAAHAPTSEGSSTHHTD